MNVYIIWETNLDTNEESFMNVVFNLKAAKEWLLFAITTWGSERAYTISKHYKGIDSFGWREWKKHAIVKNGKIIIY